MPRNMSFSLTTEQVRNRTKTVTRRTGWWKTKAGKRLIEAGDIVNACVKCMGLKPGESIERICQIRIVDVRRESLNMMLLPGDGYGARETIAEGFPEKQPHQFVSMFCHHMGGTPSQIVTRIQFEYVDEESA